MTDHQFINSAMEREQGEISSKQAWGDAVPDGPEGDDYDKELLAHSNEVADKTKDEEKQIWPTDVNGQPLKMRNFVIARPTQRDRVTVLYISVSDYMIRKDAKISVLKVLEHGVETCRNQLGDCKVFQSGDDQSRIFFAECTSIESATEYAKIFYSLLKDVEDELIRSKGLSKPGPRMELKISFAMDDKFETAFKRNQENPGQKFDRKPGGRSEVARGRVDTTRRNRDVRDVRTRDVRNAPTDNRSNRRRSPGRGSRRSPRRSPIRDATRRPSPRRVSPRRSSPRRSSPRHSSPRRAHRHSSRNRSRSRSPRAERKQSPVRDRRENRQARKEAQQESVFVPGFGMLSLPAEAAQQVTQQVLQYQQQQQIYQQQQHAMSQLAGFTSGAPTSGGRGQATYDGAGLNRY